MRRCLALAFLFVFCVSASIFAQEVTGSIFGTVTDKTGAIVKDANVTVTIDDDGSDTYVAVGGQLTVDLSGWPRSEWSGVEFKTSNPSVLALSGAPTAASPPLAHFSADETGASRVDAASADGHYTFEVRVTVDG